MLKIHSRYDTPPSLDQNTSGLSETLQDAKDECDINKIIARHARTGLWSDSVAPPGRRPQFDDFSSVADYQTAQNVLITAQEAFESMSAQIRKRFDNNPAKLLEFLEDVANREEAIKLGLVDAPEPPPGVIVLPSDAPGA